MIISTTDTLEEILSISTGLATRPSRLSPKKCINKSIWLATGGHPPWVHHGYLPGANKLICLCIFWVHESWWPQLKWTRFLLVIIVRQRCITHQCYNSQNILGNELTKEIFKNRQSSGTLQKLKFGAHFLKTTPLIYLLHDLYRYQTTYPFQHAMVFPTYFFWYLRALACSYLLNLESMALTRVYLH